MSSPVLVRVHPGQWQRLPRGCELWWDTAQGALFARFTGRVARPPQRWDGPRPETRAPTTDDRVWREPTQLLPLVGSRLMTRAARWRSSGGLR